MIQAALDGAQEIGKRRGVQTRTEVVYAYPPITSGEKVSPEKLEAAGTGLVLVVCETVMQAEAQRDAAYAGEHQGVLAEQDHHMHARCYTWRDVCVCDCVQEACRTDLTGACQKE